jgi:hypothetical protein
MDIQTGPCESGESHYCTKIGTAKLDPAGTGLTMVFLCPACTGYRSNLADLAEGEQSAESVRVITLDLTYGMGAAA